MVSVAFKTSRVQPCPAGWLRGFYGFKPLNSFVLQIAFSIRWKYCSTVMINRLRREMNACPPRSLGHLPAIITRILFKWEQIYWALSQVWKNFCRVMRRVWANEGKEIFVRFVSHTVAVYSWIVFTQWQPGTTQLEWIRNACCNNASLVFWWTSGSHTVVVDRINSRVFSSRKVQNAAGKRKSIYS